MRRALVITILGISHSQAVKLQSQGFFDNFADVAKMGAAMSGNSQAMEMVNGISNMGQQMQDGNIGAGLTAGLGTMGGVLPGQAGQVVNMVSDNAGAGVDAFIAQDPNAAMQQLAGGAAAAVADQTGNQQLANNIQTAGMAAGQAGQAFQNQDYTGGAQGLLNAGVTFTPGQAQTILNAAGTGVISGVENGMNSGLQSGITTGLNTGNQILGLTPSNDVMQQPTSNPVLMQNQQMNQNPQPIAMQGQNNNVAMLQPANTGMVQMQPQPQPQIQPNMVVQQQLPMTAEQQTMAVQQQMQQQQAQQQQVAQVPQNLVTDGNYVLQGVPSTAVLPAQTVVTFVP